MDAHVVTVDEDEYVNHEIMFKCILIGDQAVGKSSILSRITGHEFKDNYDATVGVEFSNFHWNIDGRLIKMQIWDTAGMESFRSITRIFYRGTHLIWVVYDITKDDSFENIDEWNKEIQSNNNYIYQILGSNDRILPYFY